MKKKLLLSVLGVLLLSLLIIPLTFANVEDNKLAQKTEKTAILPQDDVWCITFQLVWNEFMDKFSNGKPVRFVGGNPLIADELNKKLYSKDDISKSSYYIAQGKMTASLKKKIEFAIYKKFKEKSDILDKLDWSNKNSYLFYAMLKKEFNYLTPFDNLEALSFNKSEKPVKFFGINENSKNALRNNVSVLFYNSENDFAVKLLTKENEDVILFRTDMADSFENLYSYVIKNQKDEKFGAKDVLFVPEIDVDKTISYDSLCNRQIEGSNFVVSQAIQTIKFKIDNKGGRLKSEAAMSVMKMSLEDYEPKRYFVFNKPFVLFLKEAKKDKPYYAMKLNDTRYLVEKK